MSNNRLLSIITILLSGGIGSLVLFPTFKASAVNPSGSARFLNLNIDYKQCMTKANQAASIVLSSVDEQPHTVSEGVLGLFGQTSESVANIMCIQDGSNSIFTVVAKGDGHFDRGDGEAKSITNRFIQIMSGDL